MDNKKIVLLCGKDLSSKVVYHELEKKFGISLVIAEDPENKLLFIKRRIKRLGLSKVIGQILFNLFIYKPLTFLSKRRLSQILADHNLNDSDFPADKFIAVDSINSEATLKAIQEVYPDLIIVNGTRIISKKILNNVNCKLINTHAGITPKYRGVHGMYWALVNDDVKNSGVTVHYVDAGIDTGNIIDQIQVLPTERDNFTTYPILQLAFGVKILCKAIDDYFNGNIVLKTGTQESELWSHPTFFEYINFRISKKVK